MQSPLYYDIPKTERYEDLIIRMEQYANDRNMDVFLFRVPKSDLESKSYEQEGCFIIMLLVSMVGTSTVTAMLSGPPASKEASLIILIV